MAEFKITTVKGTISLANFEEIKKDMVLSLEKYKLVQVNEDNYTEAKSFRAKLNNFEKDLNKAKIDNKKAYLEPYMVFEGQIKELQSLVSEVSGEIDKGVKEIEEKELNEKKQKIYDLHKNLLIQVSLEKLYNPRWENKGYKLSTIEEELVSAKAQIDKDLEYINNSVANDEPILKAMTRLNYLDNLSLIDSIEKAKESFAKTMGETKVQVANQTNEDMVVKSIDITITCNQQQWKALVNFSKQMGIKIEKLKGEKESE